MCLFVDLETTEEVRQRLREAGGWLTVYKYLKLDATGEALASPYVSAFGSPFHWQSGWNVAKGELPSPITAGTIVRGGGFHVFIDEPALDESSDSSDSPMFWPFRSIDEPDLDEPALDEPSTLTEIVTVPLRAFERDFVGAGRDESARNIHAMFRRLHLAIADHELARKQLRERTVERQGRARRMAEMRPYLQWVRENQDAAWLSRALVDMAPAGSTEQSRVWIQHRERHRPLRMVPFGSLKSGRQPLEVA